MTHLNNDDIDDLEEEIEDSICDEVDDDDLILAV
jgi:hypothetical protein